MWQNLYSPNYPNNYDNYEDCGLQILASTGVVFLEIIDLHLERSYDYVEFYDGGNEQAPLIASYSENFESVIVFFCRLFFSIRYHTDRMVIHVVISDQFYGITVLCRNFSFHLIFEIGVVLKT